MKTVFSKDGTKIAYDILGNGPPLIYITGAICFRQFKPVLDDAKCFSSQFKVYNYDRRGRGDSGNTLPYSLDRELDDIEALIDEAGGRAQLYGHSSGAILAMEASLRMPQKIEKVVIYDPSYVHDAKEKEDYEKLRQKVAQRIAEKAYAKAVKTFLVGIGMPKVFVYLLPLMPGWKSIKALAPTLLYDIELTRNLPPYDRLSKITVPIKIMYGQKNPDSIKVVSKNIAQVIPASTLLALEGQDHMVSAKVLLPLF